ncbi:MAG: ArsR/SmtB family transcription factor [Acidimicrobiia bacterium]
MSAAEADAVARLMEVLATPSRVRILSRLRSSPCAVGDLADAVEMAQPAVSHQLRVLRDRGLVVGTRSGRQVVYALHDPHIGAVLDEAIGHMAHRRLLPISADATPDSRPTRKRKTP